MSGSSCIDVLEDAISKYDHHEIIHSNQECQYTSKEWISKVRDLNIKISMTGKGRFNDNAYIERLCRTVKYERLKLKFIPTVERLKIELKNFMDWYNV